MEELFEGLLAGNVPFVVEEVVPESRIEQVPDEVLLAAAVKVHGHPVLQKFVVGKFLVIVRIAVAEEIPARPRRAGHGGRFALALLAFIGYVYPFFCVFEGRVAAVRLVIVHFGQYKGKLAVVKEGNFAVFKVNDGQGFAPVPLAGKNPLAQLIGHRLFAAVVLFKPLSHCVYGVLFVEPV